MHHTYEKKTPAITFLFDYDPQVLPLEDHKYFQRGFSKNIFLMKPEIRKYFDIGSYTAAEFATLSPWLHRISFYTNVLKKCDMWKICKIYQHGEGEKRRKKSKHSSKVVQKKVFDM